MVYIWYYRLYVVNRHAFMYIRHIHHFSCKEEALEGEGKNMKASKQPRPRTGPKERAK